MKQLPIKLSFLFSFLANVDGIISLTQRLLKIDTLNKNENIMTNTNAQLLFQILSITVTFLGAYYFLTQLFKLKEKMKIIGTITLVRSMRLFDRMGTNEDKQEYLEDEFQTVKKQLLSVEMKNKTNEEIDKLLSDFYEIHYPNRKK